jgi:hypothetical protein
MANKAVYGIATSYAQAEEVVCALESAGFSSDDVSVLLPDTKGTRDFAHEHHTKAPEGATAGASAGGLLGGGLGWLAGIGALAIPGLGPFIAAGPIMAALGGAAIGAAVGGVSGALIGLGMPELEAKQYENKLKAGNILLSVHTDDGDELSSAKKIFEANGVSDVSTVGEAKAPLPNKSERSRNLR